MNPKFGDIYKWNATQFKVMYISPGPREGMGWSGVVLTNDEGEPSLRQKVGEDWVWYGVRTRALSATGYWEKIDDHP